MTDIPFCDLSRAHAPIRRDMDRAIANCLDRSYFLRGPETKGLEEEWAAYCGSAHAVCCNSGTDALSIAATALGIKEAVIPANTLPLTGIGLHRGGAEVRVGEINERGWLANASEQAVPVLMFGQLPAPDAPRARLYDAAHAHGWKPPAGSVAAWSFYPTKTLGCLGDAGAVTTDDASLAEEMRRLCGRDDQLHDRRQITSRIDEIQAAVLRVKLRHLDDWLEQRSEIGAIYDAFLGPLGITLGQPSLNHLYVVRVRGRQRLMAHLSGLGIQTKLHWETPLHRMSGPWTAVGDFPIAEDWCGSILSLPCFPGLRREEVERVCHEILDWHAAEKMADGKP
jgi:dTDP-3-amino-3,4,6-trideoxy-alpha-D-glucose transaminase